MFIDTIEGFKALKHFGIHAVRAKIVDSAEDAIAFAERRNAPDPRFVPILLRAGEQGQASATLTSEDAIRRAYAYFAQVPNHPAILAVEATGRGTDITIAGRTDPSDGKIVALRSQARGVERMMPLDSAGAEYLASHYQGHDHQGASEKTRRMLEHLVLGVSGFFEHSGVTEFKLTVRLHDNAYTVIAAAMTAPHALHFKERLDKHAHDRKAADYHPAGKE